MKNHPKRLHENNSQARVEQRKDKFEKVAKAYFVLSDPQQKKLYDQLCLGILPLDTEQEPGANYHEDAIKVFNTYFSNFSFKTPSKNNKISFDSPEKEIKS